MSILYEAKDEDIEVNPENKDVNIYVFRDFFGVTYVSLTFEQIKKINSQILLAELAEESQRLGLVE